MRIDQLSPIEKKLLLLAIEHYRTLILKDRMPNCYRMRISYAYHRGVYAGDFIRRGVPIEYLNQYFEEHKPTRNKTDLK